MAPESRKRTLGIVAGALVVVAIGAWYFMWPDQSGDEAGSLNEARTAAAASQKMAMQAPDVHLPALGAERPKPVDASRDLFRFKPKPTPAPPPPPPMPTGTPAPTGPPTPPPPPVIKLRFIGIVTKEGKKYATLSDSTGHPETGSEGDIIQGRYRILKIGEESVEVAYLDGTGRRTIRLGAPSEG